MRILHIMGSADYGGISSVIYNYMTNIDRDKYCFDFALNTEPGYLGHEMMKMGARFFKLPLRSAGLKKYKEALTDLLKKEHFDILHVHSSTTSYVDLRIAKKMGIKCRIAHAHSTPGCKTVKDYFRKYSGWILNPIYATKLVGCGQKAGNEIFGKLNMRSKKGIILPNAINIDKYRFNEKERTAVRRELGLGRRYVIGMVAVFSARKNHIFALKVIEEIFRVNKNFILVCVGSGAELFKCLKYCTDHKMQDCVMFLGKRDDVSRLYNGFDAFVLPSSAYEGLPVVGIEALTSGLPLILADTITDEFDFGQFVQYLPLESDKWANVLLSKPFNEDRNTGYYEAKNHGFDIKDKFHVLEKIYSEYVTERESQ